VLEIFSSYSSRIIMPFVNLRIATGDEIWKAVVNYFVPNFFLVRIHISDQFEIFCMSDINLALGCEQL